jgi:hypothetical protein
MNIPSFTKNQWIGISSVVATFVVGVVVISFQHSTTEYAPQAMQGSPGGIQVQGNLNVEKNQFPKPIIEYSATSPLTQDESGFYHRTFELRFYYVLGTAPKRTFKVSDFFTDCSDPKTSSAPGFTNGRYFESSTIDCRMKTSPPADTVLFWYPD